MAQLGQRQSSTSSYATYYRLGLGRRHSVDAIQVPVVRNCESNAGCTLLLMMMMTMFLVLLDTLASEDEYSSSSSSFTPPSGELCLLWLSCWRASVFLWALISCGGGAEV